MRKWEFSLPDKKGREKGIRHAAGAGERGNPAIRRKERAEYFSAEAWGGEARREKNANWGREGRGGTGIHNEKYHVIKKGGGADLGDQQDDFGSRRRINGGFVKKNTTISAA